MKTKIHATAGCLGFLTIAIFWTSTVIVELFGSEAAIAFLKEGILWGMIILIPAMAIAGGSGMSLAGNSSYPTILRKKKRMPFIALNGLIILLPSAIFLAIKASAGEFDATFYTVQGIELLAGATNLTLMGFNIHDGLSMRKT